MARTRGLAPVLASASFALLVAAPVLPFTTAITPAIAAEREPVMSENLEHVAHRDNPLRQGDSHYFINSDLAFTGDILVQGNFDGFSLWDIADPADPRLLSAVRCPGGQGDVTAVGDLVFVSVDETMSSDRCDAERVPETEPNWDGIRIFSIADPTAPEYLAAVRTRCGSHTHTLIPDPAAERRVFLYVNAYSRGASLHCTGRNPQQIIAVDLDDPAAAAIVAEPDYFSDETAFGPSDRVPGGAETRSTTGCHDLNAYPAIGRAVAACRGDAVLLDISDPLAPVVLQTMRDPNVAFWHSGIFSPDGRTIVFQDELGDGFVNTCSPATGAERGANGIWTLVDGVYEHLGYDKIPREQSPLEKCVAHSGGIVPVPGRFVIVQAWLEGGFSVVDLSDPASPRELAHFDKPSYGRAMDFTAGIWSAYYYKGHVFASDMYDGLEVFRLTGPEFDALAAYPAEGLNPQTQEDVDAVWRALRAPPEPSEGALMPQPPDPPEEAAAPEETSADAGVPAAWFIAVGTGTTVTAIALLVAVLRSRGRAGRHP